MKISFINFRNYYKNKHLSVDIKALRNSKLPKPIFNKNGKLLLEANGSNKPSFSYVRLNISKIKYLKNIFWKLKKLLNRDKIICEEKGLILCAILQKL